MYGAFGREITIHTVKYSVHIRFWPTLDIEGHTQGSNRGSYTGFNRGRVIHRVLTEGHTQGSNRETYTGF